MLQSSICSGSWNKFGSGIDGETAHDKFGLSVSMPVDVDERTIVVGGRGPSHATQNTFACDLNKPGIALLEL